MEPIKINIAKEFATTLGLRFEHLSPNVSGEKFYKDLLKPKYDEAVRTNQDLIIELDGATPYGSSFISQSFGVLAKEYDKDDVYRRIKFVTSYYPHVVTLIQNIILKPRENN